MSYANGQLPGSELAPLVGNPGKYLRKDAAAAFNAMYHRRPVHVRDAYRILGHPGDLDRGVWSQWACWERYKYHGGPLAAVPGTSNHGWGLAVDLYSTVDRGIVDSIGAPFGYSKSWSDAPSEWWHVLYKVGVWQPAPTHHASYSGSGNVYFEVDGYVDFDHSDMWHITIRGVRSPGTVHPSYHNARGKAYFKIPGHFSLDRARWSGGVLGRPAP